jgi:hypothetical protein
LIKAPSKAVVDFSRVAAVFLCGKSFAKKEWFLEIPPQLGKPPPNFHHEAHEEHEEKPSVDLNLNFVTFALFVVKMFSQK